MFKVTFTSLKQAQDLNSLTEAQIVSILKTAMENRNYRAAYNRQKSALSTLLKNDPIVRERMESLRKKA